MDEKQIIEELIQDWALEWKSDQEVLFKELFLAIYYKTKGKKEKNRKLNFIWKFIFIGVIFIGILALVVLLYIGIKNKWKKSDCIWAESVVLFIIVVIDGLVSKWMDIMRYQETWARHSLLVHEMESEIVKYKYGIKQYRKNSDKKHIFIRSVIRIWDNNQLIFSDNMKNNERILMDYFKGIGKFA